ncbi:hypothetical protein P5G50_02840 [Leifsonia sp. F6_8S_P_1B]|uniref:DUF4025 domain-containing protein n=1 Tax=Leifsonia williamsii TaxID=3035919 RepID=A0ABT8K7D2_9MICO|nr:hypothetical protein [Leifsonia williamsii]MDN4613380.1 hypothetical protein [Leifsonia williamsii]
MSTPHEDDRTGRIDDEARDDLEGSYTEVDGEAPHERTVHGQYTETDGVGPETVTEGSYTDTDEAVEQSTETPQGEYTEGDYEEP